MHQFIHSYILNSVGMSPLVSGFFWDDVWNPECNIHDQVKNTCQDMGLAINGPELQQLTKDYQANMAALRNATLAAGKFAWQMLWSGGDPDSIGERADFDAPYLYPQGIDYVIVNGKIAVENGEVADGRAGQVLRRRHE